MCLRGEAAAILQGETMGGQTKQSQRALDVADRMLRAGQGVCSEILEEATRTGDTETALAAVGGLISALRIMERDLMHVMTLTTDKFKRPEVSEVAAQEALSRMLDDMTKLVRSTLPRPVWS